MKLSEKQIEELHQFVKSKYVEYYDVQVELVDHLASSIELKMVADANLAFDAALQEIYKDFGLFGFSGYEESVQKLVYKQGRILFWQEFKSFFKLPQFLFTILLTTLYYLLAVNFAPKVFLVATIIPALGLAALGIWKQWQFKKSLKTLLTKAEFGTSVFVSSGSFINLINMLYKPTSETAHESYLFIGVIVSLFIIVLLAQLKAMKNIRKELKRDYAVAFK